MSTTWRRLLLLLIFLCLPAWAEAPSAGADLSACDRLVEATLREMYELEKPTYVVDLLSNPYKERSFSPEEELILRPLAIKEPIGLFTVAAEVWCDGRLAESRQVRLRIRQFDSVLVASDRIGRHDLLTAANLRSEWTEVTTLKEKPYASLEELSDVWAGRSIRKGKVLTSADVELIPQVQSGREVTIVYEEGPCRISAVGTALQSGVTGDQVRIKNKSSGKTITARVLAEDVVTVDP